MSIPVTSPSVAPSLAGAKLTAAAVTGKTTAGRNVKYQINNFFKAFLSPINFFKKIFTVNLKKRKVDYVNHSEMQDGIKEFRDEIKKMQEEFIAKLSRFDDNTEGQLNPNTNAAQSRLDRRAEARAIAGLFKELPDHLPNGGVTDSTVAHYQPTASKPLPQLEAGPRLPQLTAGPEELEAGPKLLQLTAGPEELEAGPQLLQLTAGPEELEAGPQLLQLTAGPEELEAGPQLLQLTAGPEELEAGPQLLQLTAGPEELEAGPQLRQLTEDPELVRARKNAELGSHLPNNGDSDAEIATEEKQRAARVEGRANAELGSHLPNYVDDAEVAAITDRASPQPLQLTEEPELIRERKNSEASRDGGDGAESESASTVSYTEWNSDGTLFGESGSEDETGSMSSRRSSTASRGTPDFGHSDSENETGSTGHRQFSAVTSTVTSHFGMRRGSL